MLDQQSGELVGLAVQLAVGQLGVLEDECGGVWGAGGLGLEQFGQGGLGRLPGGGVPLREEPVPLRRIEDVDSVDGCVGVGRDGFQDSQQPLDDVLGCCLVEQVGCEGESTVQSRRSAVTAECFTQREVQVEFGGCLSGVDE